MLSSNKVDLYRYLYMLTMAICIYIYIYFFGMFFGIQYVLSQTDKRLTAMCLFSSE